MQKDLDCDGCDLGLLDTQERAKICKGWEDEGRGPDLDQLEDTVQFS